MPSTPERFGPEVLMLDADEAIEHIVQRLRHILSRDLGKRGLVIAMSGGIDSSLCAALSVRAIGTQPMATRRLGVVMHGVTGRMGLNQHLIRSIAAIREQGGVLLADGGRVLPDPILIGRSAERVAALARAHGIERWGTDLAAALADPDDTVFFDAATTQMRPALLTQAIEAGKHVYCEKTVATTLDEALALHRLAESRGVKHRVVQDKLFLPGLRKLKLLIDAAFFGRVLAVRGEFGYWVFEGDLQPIQRPSWNYRAQSRSAQVLAIPGTRFCTSWYPLP